MQRTDLSLVDYRYTLTCQTAEFQEDGTLLLAVTENSIQNFAAHPMLTLKVLLSTTPLLW